MAAITVKLDDDLLARLDEAAGNTKRSVWIREAIEEKLAPSLRAPAQPTGGCTTTYLPSVGRPKSEIPHLTGCKCVMCIGEAGF